MSGVSEITVTEQLSPGLLKSNVMSFSVQEAALQRTNAYSHPPWVKLSKATDIGLNLSSRGAMKSLSNLVCALLL